MRRKVCKQCNAEKDLRQFCRHSHYADGHENICKVCKRANVKENAELKFEYYRAKKRIWSSRPENIAKRKAYARSERGKEVKRGCYRRRRDFLRLVSQSGASA